MKSFHKYKRGIALLKEEIFENKLSRFGFQNQSQKSMKYIDPFSKYTFTQKSIYEKPKI